MLGNDQRPPCVVHYGLGHTYLRAFCKKHAAEPGESHGDPAQCDVVVTVTTSKDPVLRGETDIAVGSRYLAPRAEGYRSSATRRLGIRILARVVSLLTHQRVTDTTSGFQVLNRKAIALFAADYPHDYPEVEAAVMLHKHRLRLAEVPVRMRERSAGASSITALRSIYYMIKVMLAILVGAMRRRATPLEDT